MAWTDDFEAAQGALTTLGADYDAQTTALNAALAAQAASQQAYLDAQSQIAALSASVVALQAQLADALAAEIPAGALYVASTGSDSNPGTGPGAPRRTVKYGATNVLMDDQPGLYLATPANTTTVVMAWPGRTITCDGKGVTKRAVLASGRLDLLGDIVFVNYAQTGLSITGAALYYGGTSAGSILHGPTIKNAASVALGHQVPLVVTALNVDTCGYSGILGTTCDGTMYGDVKVSRTNRGNHGLDGQNGGIKVTRAKGVHFSKGVVCDDSNGTIGLWTDVSCQAPVFAGCTSTNHHVALQSEETEGGYVVGCSLQGDFAANIAATGHMTIWRGCCR